MPHSLGPTRPDEIDALGAFLARGFGVPNQSRFAARDILAWKYARSTSGSPFGSLVARDAQGAIIGHVGYCRTTLHLAADSRQSINRHPILHMIDWLAATGHPGIGVELARAAHELAELGYGQGGTPASRRAVNRLGYALRGQIVVHRRVLRPLSALRSDEPLHRRLARVARDSLRRPRRNRQRRSRSGVMLQPAIRFGDEVEPLFDAALRRDAPIAATARSAALLNHRLDYPRGGLTGWHLVRPGASEPLVGFATLAIDDAPLRTGTIVDLVLARSDPAMAHDAVEALTAELRRQGADTARVCGLPSRGDDALAAAGYQPAYSIPWYVRDPAGIWPESIPAWLSFHEADYAVPAS